MENAVEFLRNHARVLHRAAQQQAPAVVEGLRAVHELKGLEPEAMAKVVQRKHCLALVALRLGAKAWDELVAQLNANVGEDFGTLWHVNGYWNVWSASYDEARTIRADHGGYLLPYRRQFMIVESHYVEGLGVDATNPDWDRIARNWLEPTDVEARARLAIQVLRQKLGVN
jgi:hypothetical protein